MYLERNIAASSSLFTEINRRRLIGHRVAQGVGGLQKSFDLKFTELNGRKGFGSSQCLARPLLRDLRQAMTCLRCPCVLLNLGFYFLESLVALIEVRLGERARVRTPPIAPSSHE